MRKSLLSLALVLAVAPVAAYAVGPTVSLTLPALNTTPGTFGSLPFPCDLYFDQGRPGDGDGTLLNTGASIGLGVAVVPTNTASIEQALDLLDGFGTSTGVYFFLGGAIDAGSLPSSPVLTAALTDSVFCADTATLTPVPIAVKPNVDSRIPNVLAVLPLPGRPLKAKTAYTCVVRRAVTGGGDPVEPSADWVSVRDGASANSDADAIFDPVVAALAGVGVAASDIAGMTVFTTESTTVDLTRIRDEVLPGLPVPTANFTSRPELIFDTPAELTALLGSNPHADVATVATGYYESARFQTLDPDGLGVLSDLPLPPSFVTCAVPCETTDERFTRDGTGKPIVISVPEIPFTIVIPSGTPPAGGWPVIIQQHGLGGQRDTVAAFGELDAAKGFASIGIDAVSHGYRLFNCGPGSVCSQDTANNVGGTAVPDGFVDGSFAGFSVSFLAVNLGFFQAFHNFLGIRDNFRQTYVDLLSLVRLLHGHSIDGALGTTLDDTNIYYMGHSLGGLMGAGFVPIETGLKASLLNAAGGGLTSQLFINSSIGAGAQALVNGILGLDPLNVPDQFALSTNLTQMVVDPADGVNSASLLLTPDAGSARNVILVEDYGDQVVPNQANEALAIAANLSIIDPYVQNLHMSPVVLPIANPGTPRVLSANAAGGTATAGLLQNGPATHAQSLLTQPASVTFVPEFAHADDFLLTGNGFPTLQRPIRVPNVGIFDDVAAWFRDIVTSGPPGTFNFTGQFNYNSIENLDAPAGASVELFFSRLVDAGGALATFEPTSDVTVTFNTNPVATRVTAGRTTLGTGPLATDADVPPGPFSTVGTPGILPFFVTLQRQLPGVFDASVAIAYTATDLLLAGIPPGSPVEGALVVGTFTPGACAVAAAVCSEDGGCGANGPCLGATYATLPTTVDTTAHTATATGISSFSTFAVLHPDALGAGFRTPLVPGGGGPNADCRAEWQVRNLTNTPYLDKRGRVNATQTCHDGDPVCDQDGTVNGTCVFSLGMCLNQADPSLPGCVPDTTASYRLLSPRPSAKNPLDVTNAQAILASLTALGGTLGGPHADLVTYSPALTGDMCTALTGVSVPTRGTKPGKRSVHGRARPASGPGDSDRLTLICTP